MFLKLSSGILAVAAMCAFAQDPATPQGADRAKSDAMTVTGCVAKDANAKDLFTITGEDGKSYTLKSGKLSSHVNHKVTVTGKVTKEAEGTTPGDMTVSDVKMISETCK